jgi:hypothetical protein
MRVDHYQSRLLAIRRVRTKPARALVATLDRPDAQLSLQSLNLRPAPGNVRAGVVTRGIAQDVIAGLERLLRYCARPPFALERLEQSSDEQLVYRLDKPQPDGRTQLRLTPLELIERLVA